MLALGARGKPRSCVEMRVAEGLAKTCYEMWALPPALVAAPSLGSRTRCRSVQSRLCASLLVHACAQARVCVIACVRERA